MTEEHQPHHTGRTRLEEGKFIALESIDWMGQDGVARKWETAERVIGREAVLLIPWLRPSNTLVLIKQYRPPADAYVLEFPAGLVDEGETAESAAMRELYEETGYKGTILRIIPPTFNSPGLTSETVHQVFVDIDETSAANVGAEPHLDEGEHIEVVLLKRGAVAHFLQKQITEGARFDSKLVTYLTGMLTEKELSKSEGDFLSRFFKNM